MVDALVRGPHVHEQGLELARDPDAEELGAGLHLAVGEDDEQPVRRGGLVEVRGDERDERREAGRAPAAVRLARRRLVDPDRLCQRAREEGRVGRRHHVGKRAVGHRRDPDRHVAERRMQLSRDSLRTREAVRKAGARGGEHRPRCVEDEERLRVSALLHELAPHHDRLGGSDSYEHRQERERDDDRHDRPPAGAADAEDRPDLAAAALDEQNRRERDCGSEREERPERREERDPEQRERHQ